MLKMYFSPQNTTIFPHRRVSAPTQSIKGLGLGFCVSWLMHEHRDVCWRRLEATSSVSTYPRSYCPHPPLPDTQFKSDLPCLIFVFLVFVWRHRWRHSGPYSLSSFLAITSDQIKIESRERHHCVGNQIPHQNYMQLELPSQNCDLWEVDLTLTFRINLGFDFF